MDKIINGTSGVDTERYIVNENGDILCEHKDSIRIELNRFNPEDNRIKVLIKAIEDKSNELGFKIISDDEIFSQGAEHSWREGFYGLYITSY